MIRKVAAIVREAGRIALRRDFTIEQKDGFENLVTSADKEVQRFLVSRLSALLPGSGFMGEEDGLRQEGAEYLWIIDPIDGTANFARGIPQYSISVALARRGEIVLGVVYNPADGQLFRAEKGKGAYLGNRRIHTSERVFADSILCTAMSVYRKEFAPVCNRIIMDAYGQCNDLRRFGACAIELCYLAMGQIDLFFEIRVQPWDCAAGSLIVTEAGGAVSGLHGAPLNMDGSLLISGANNAANLERLNGIISKHLKKIPYKD